MAVASAPVLRTTNPVLLTREFPGKDSIMELAASAGGFGAKIRQVDRRVIRIRASEAVDSEETPDQLRLGRGDMIRILQSA